MAEKTIRGFDILFDLAITYVERFSKRPKEVWDHTAWLDFLLDTQKKGIEISDDIKTYFGLIMESMKNLYEASLATQGMEDVTLEIFKETLKFVKKTRGVYDPSEWEAFLKNLLKKNIHLTEESRTYLIKVLRAVIDIYTVSTPISERK